MHIAQQLDLPDFEIIEGEQALQIAQKWLSVFCSHRTSFKGIRGGKLESFVWLGTEKCTQQTK